jgi:hypothetical protein
MPHRAQFVKTYRAFPAEYCGFAILGAFSHTPPSANKEEPGMTSDRKTLSAERGRMGWSALGSVACLLALAGCASSHPTAPISPSPTSGHEAKADLHGPDKPLDLLAQCEIAASKAPPGLYPDWLRHRQVYWTLVGLPSDFCESLLDEYGNLEPVAGSSSLMPYLFINGQLLSVLDSLRGLQTLDSGYLPLPSVAVEFDGLNLDIQAFAWGSLVDSVTFIRYRVSNPSAQPRKGRLFLAIRPFQVNPPWQHGGLSPIRSLEYAQIPEGASVRINGSTQYVSLTPVDSFGTRPFNQGDIARELAKGILPTAQKVENAGDLISGALAYDFDLQPGQSRSIVIAAPLHDSLTNVTAFTGGPDGRLTPDEAFEANQRSMRYFWAEQVDQVVMDLPDQEVLNTLKSQIAYILINRDGNDIQPGSRNYKRAFMRDGSLTAAALLRMGLVEPVREFTDWYAARVQPDGPVPPILNNDGTVNGAFGPNLEYDSQGEFIFAILEHYRFTGDRAFLQKHYPKMQAALRVLVQLRERTLAPDYMKDEPARERFAGILPKSYSHGGYSTPVHSYWDDFFALKGWKDGKAAAQALGDTNTAAWAEEQYLALRASVKTSIEATIAYHKIDFIPGCAEKGDRDPTSTAIAIFPCDEQDLLPQDLLRKTFEAYYDEMAGRAKPGWSGSFTAFEVRNITSFIHLGRKDRANDLLNFILSCRRPPEWNHLAALVLSDPRAGGHIGDMPHTWAGSDLINAVRGMLVREDGGQLVLLAGAPESWVRERNGIRLDKLPTYFGTLSLTAHAANNRLDVSIAGVNPPGGFVLTWPLAGKPKTVTVDNQPWQDFDDQICRLPAETKVVAATW